MERNLDTTIKYEYIYRPEEIGYTLQSKVVNIIVRCVYRHRVYICTYGAFELRMV